MSSRSTRSTRKGKKMTWSTGSRRKTTLARRARAANSPYAGRYMPGFPSKQKVAMRYVQTVQLDATAGAISSYIFRANSIADPDVPSAIPKQPLGYKEWLVFYNHYLVTDCKVTAKFCGENANIDPLIMGIYLADDLTMPPTGNDVVEQGLAKYKTGNPGTNNDIISAQVTNRFNAKKFFNVTDLKDNFTRFGAAFGANPAELAFFHVFVTALNNLADADKVFVQVILDYNVILSEPKSLTPSALPQP